MSESAKHKYKLLVDRLLDRTLEKKLLWQTLPASDVDVFITLGERVIELSPGRNSNAEPILTVSIYDPQGKVLDSFNDETLRGFIPDKASYGGYWALMSDLHKMAIRQSTGADEAIDQVLEQLDDIPF